MKEKIFVYGASGHAKVVIDIIEKQGLYDIAFLIDDDISLKGQAIYSYTVLGGKPDLLISGIKRGIVAIGNNRARSAVASWLTENGFVLISALHPAAQLARGVIVENGTIVMAGAVINSDAHIGRNVIVNTRASIDHDCIIGDGVHIAPGATLCGAVSVGPGSFVCAGSTIIPNLNIGSNVVIGAGATVISDIPDCVMVVGSPAKVLKRY